MHASVNATSFRTKASQDAGLNHEGSHDAHQALDSFHSTSAEKCKFCVNVPTLPSILHLHIYRRTGFLADPGQSDSMPELRMVDLSIKIQRVKQESN